MLCFEVYRNDEKVCTAGIRDFGVLTAMVAYVAHRPDKLARWMAEGIPADEGVYSNLSVGGLKDGGEVKKEHLRWVDTALLPGDEIRIRLVDLPDADPPQHREDGEERA